MSATNRYMNWSGVSFTPSGGSAIVIDGVTDIKVTRSGNPETFKGDVAKYPQVAAVPDQMRSLTVSSANIGKMLGALIGSVGAFTATLNDFYNGSTAGGGGVVLALTNCLVTETPFDGQHAKVAGGSITFVGFVADGVTDPLTVTAV